MTVPGFIDESGRFKDHRIICIGCVAGFNQHVEDFARAWGRLLALNGMENFHVANPKAPRTRLQGNTPRFELRQELFRMTGKDLTQIDGVDVMTPTTILSEVGWDMSKWKTENHFVSWLRLCPDNTISGAKIIGKGRLPTNNRATNALKMAASSLRLSNTYLGAQFRRLRTKLGTRWRSRRWQPS